MKAAPADQRLLLDLAERDTEVARLDHRVANSPEGLAVTELESALQRSRDEAVAADIAADDLDREVRRLDNEIAVLSNRERKDSALLNGGTLSGKALTELEHELSGIARRRAVLEDELLEVMEQQEATAAAQLRAAAVVSHTEEQLAAARTALAAELESIAAARVVAEEKRHSLRTQIDQELLAVYDRQRVTGSSGAGLLRQASCGACRMEFDRGTLSRIARLAADEVVRCDECGAILVRTHESGL
ncbi:zinc ribbon domain-containing protein [Williamsia sp. CHRR-6]|uniref:zinc ribbon domain-containing protein n=1 Tax=Williamsia sp. CHRR-6 TaxID=2835871 RepID=UPI001BD92BD3|nr:C4-type zinc ribbon domain-containing protein [Williamsia sp. CHRR-6]MBT0565337.1 hypothetical protein [Williamsia sp. CHRR-6]